MNNLLGRVIDTKVTDKNDHAYAVQNSGITFQLPRDQGQQPLQIGEHVRGFAYENEQHELVITTTLPQVQVDHYAFGTVVASRRDLGVFVDIGLPDKDIVVSLDDLPTLKQLWPKTGDKLMISLVVDSKNRLWGQLADDDIFTAISNQAPAKMQNQNLTVIAYRLKMAGTLVISDHNFLGFIHPSERDEEPRLGQVLTARVIDVHEDGTLNLSVKPRAYEAIGEDAQMLLTLLEKSSTNSLPYTDKSTPAAIKQYFGISKGQFKRAVGHLLKANQVIQKNGQLQLITEDS